jgi:glycosyl transferase family 92
MRSPLVAPRRPVERRGQIMSARRCYLAVCAIYKDEAPNLREWVAFHRVVGVERFYLYNNDSTDAHLEALAPYIEEGVVSVCDWSLFPGQIQAYEDCLKKHADESRWIAFIDLDEFLFSPTGRPVPELLRDYEAFPGVVVNWAMYGTSGHERRPPGLVIESYLRRTAETEYNRHLKSIVDPREVRSFCGPHFFAYREGLAVDENKQPLRTGPNRTDAVSFDRLRLNHYVTRSLEEYRRKLERPVPDVGVTKGLTPGQVRRRLEKLDQVTDESILVHLPALRRELERVGDAEAELERLTSE